MNRRNFIRNLLVGGASFTILPCAGRIWKAERQMPVFRRVNPLWVKVDYEIMYVTYSAWNKFMIGPPPVKFPANASDTIRFIK